MRCRACDSANTRVICTNHFPLHTKRYCRCLDCGEKFRTLEKYEVYRRGPKRGVIIPDTAGEKNGSSVLTTDNVIDIRRLKREGKSNRQIAAIYGINSGHVSRIVNHKVWKHIDAY